MAQLGPAFRIVIAVLGFTGALMAQAPAAFEVASVKQNIQTSPLGSMAQQQGGRFAATNIPLRQLILTAYQIQPAQLIDAPDWSRTERFDIDARATAPFPLFVPPGRPNVLHAMLRTLLADRFKLVVRMEMRELPMMTLTVAEPGRLGPRMLRSGVDCAAAAAVNGGQLPETRAGDRPVCGIAPGFGRALAGAATVGELAVLLAPQLNRVVADRTNLTDRFDFDLQWTPDNLPPRAPGTPADQPIRVNGIEIDPNGPSLATALREQLGLRIDQMTAAVPVVVVVSVDRPTPD
jgi:uncharacterized protein (TIGR03435 family)